MKRHTLTDYKKAASIIFGDAGAWAYTEWSHLNKTFFSGKLKPGPIAWGLTAYGAALGKYYPRRNLIFIHPNHEQPWIIESYDYEYKSDVLLHEMIHQKVHQSGHSPKLSHNNPFFVSEVNRISKLLGMDVKATVIKQKRIGKKVSWDQPEGFMTRDQLSRFPHSFR